MRSDDTILTLFTARIEDRDGTPVLEVPDQEIDLGTLSVGDTYRVAISRGPGAEAAADAASDGDRRRSAPAGEPPVSVGDQLDVEIEDVGEQGDGIARVGPGYVIFVPEAGVGDRVTIEITETRDNFGFAEVVTPEPIAG